MEDELTAQDITKIGIDDLGRLIVYPKLSGQDYAFIYRAGMEVNWDPQSKCLFTPVPREWSLAQWFAQIFRAMKSEYGECAWSCLMTRSGKNCRLMIRMRWRCI
jgi:hypothetical protein